MQKKNTTVTTAQQMVKIERKIEMFSAVNLFVKLFNNRQQAVNKINAMYGTNITEENN